MSALRFPPVAGPTVGCPEWSHKGPKAGTVGIRWSHWGYIGDTVGLLCTTVGAWVCWAYCLNTTWAYCGHIVGSLGTLWAYFGNTVGILWEHWERCGHIGLNVGILQAHREYIGHTRNTVGTPWALRETCESTGLQCNPGHGLWLLNKISLVLHVWNTLTCIYRILALVESSSNLLRVVHFEYLHLFADRLKKNIS